MIVDAHRHVYTWDIISDNYWNGLAEIAIDFFRRNNLGEQTKEEIKNNLMDVMMDSGGLVFTKEEIDAVLGGNAARIFNI